MPQKKQKESQPVTIRMEKATFERLEQFCEQAGQSKTVAIERAINMYVDDYDEKMKMITEKENGKNE